MLLDKVEIQSQPKEGQFQWHWELFSPHIVANLLDEQLTKE